LRPIGVSLLVFLGVGLRPGFSAPVLADDAKVAAHEHFDRGLAAVDDQRFGEAAEEFGKAYELWPDFKVLYNIGRVRVTLGQAVEAVEAFEAYLAKGGGDIAMERKEEVQREIERQLARIAVITVATSDEGADVRIDGRLVGHSPLGGPVRVTAGKHTIEALLPGRPTQLHEVEVPGASTMEMVFKFPPTMEVRNADDSAVRPPILPASGPGEVPRGRRTLGYVVGGVGLAAVLAGAALAFEGAFAANDARARLVAAATPPPPGAPDVMEYDVAKLAYDDAKTRNRLGWTVAGIGGVALIGGAALVIVSSGAPSRSGRGIAVGVVPQPAGMAVQGTW
jgi:PEGA domain